ncbi:MAG: phage holin family protein [Oscillospiraceae bacterium]|nr:phage holin family protein [Oscillospiraceae bacterium]
MSELALKGAVVTAAASVAAYFHQLTFPLLLLIIAMVLDYGTGMAAAWVNKELSSRTGIIGILKKVGYMVVVAVAVIVDMVISSALTTAGVSTNYPDIFALLVTFWLTLNELISILENLSEIGVPIPEFLMKVIHKLKQTTEEKGETEKKPGEAT